MYNVYVPYNDINIFSNYYYSKDLNFIYATNDNVNFDIINVNNHYSIVNTNNVDSSDLILIDNNNITNNWTYRNDLYEVLYSLLIFCLFFIGIPLFLLSRFFKKRW